MRSLSISLLDMISVAARMIGDNANLRQSFPGILKAEVDHGRRVAPAGGDHGFFTGVNPAGRQNDVGQTRTPPLRFQETKIGRFQR